MTDLPTHQLAPTQAPPALQRWWLNPFLHVLIAVLLTAMAQIFLKIGANTVTATDSTFLSWSGVQELGAVWTWVGIIALIASFGSWLYALRFLPLGLAFNLTNGVHVLVPIGSWLFLHEQIGLTRIAGICLIMVGIVLLAQSVAKVEEKV